MSMPRLTCALLLSLTLGACATFPELDARVGRDVTEGEFPALLPLDQVLNGPEAKIDAQSITTLQGRVAALRARAARLRARAVVDAPTRARMRIGITPRATG